MRIHGWGRDHKHDGAPMAHVDCTCGKCGWPSAPESGTVQFHRLPDDLDHPCGREVWENHPLDGDMRRALEALYGPAQEDGSWYRCVTSNGRTHHKSLPLDEVYIITVDEKPKLEVVS